MDEWVAPFSDLEARLVAATGDQILNFHTTIDDDATPSMRALRPEIQRELGYYNHAVSSAQNETINRYSSPNKPLNALWPGGGVCFTHVPGESCGVGPQYGQEFSL